MNCQDARPHLLDYQRGRIAPQLSEEIRVHLLGCAACAREEAAEEALTGLLEHRLPRQAASLALKRRLAAQWPSAPPPKPSWWRQWGRSFAPAFAVALVLLVALPLYYYQRATISQGAGTGGMVTEAVNDHLRVLSSQHPLDVESGGMHQVKPWFEGRLDFAPVLGFAGDEEFPLKGGAVGYFLDRKAAVFVFNRRLHAISLLVFRADGLPWPSQGFRPIGNTRAHTSVARGFNVVLWRSGELGYALVSDLDPAELDRLAVKVSGGS